MSSYIPTQLSFPLPRVCRETLPNGGYFTRPWGKADVLSSLAAGGRFDFRFGRHEFDSNSTALFAAQAQEFIFEAHETARFSEGSEK
ncbi:MAG: hypothetical protein KGL39_09915 [Patescibacteria group bacterium]|nr:hypothetical protein [Patescibacteria group bacterium]